MRSARRASIRLFAARSRSVLADDDAVEPRYRCGLAARERAHRPIRSATASIEIAICGVFLTRPGGFEPPTRGLEVHPRRPKRTARHNAAKSASRRRSGIESAAANPNFQTHTRQTRPQPDIEFGNVTRTPWSWDSRGMTRERLGLLRLSELGEGGQLGGRSCGIIFA